MDRVPRAVRAKLLVLCGYDTCKCAAACCQAWWELITAELLQDAAAVIPALIWRRVLTTFSPLSRRGHAVGMVLSGGGSCSGELLVFGGNGHSNMDLCDVHRLAVDTGEWHAGPHMSASPVYVRDALYHYCGRAWHASCTVPGVGLLVNGGIDDGMDLDSSALLAKCEEEWHWMRMPAARMCPDGADRGTGVYTLTEAELKWSATMAHHHCMVYHPQTRCAFAFARLPSKEQEAGKEEEEPPLEEHVEEDIDASGADVCAIDVSSLLAATTRKEMETAAAIVSWRKMATRTRGVRSNFSGVAFGEHILLVGEEGVSIYHVGMGTWIHHTHEGVQLGALQTNIGQYYTNRHWYNIKDPEGGRCYNAPVAFIYNGRLYVHDTHRNLSTGMVTAGVLSCNLVGILLLESSTQIAWHWHQHALQEGACPALAHHRVCPHPAGGFLMVGGGLSSRNPNSNPHPHPNPPHGWR